MAGHTVNEAHAACLAAREKAKQNTHSTPSTHIATPNSISSSPTPLHVSSMSSQDTVFLNEKLYVPAEASWAPAPASSSAHIAKVTSFDTPLFPYHAFLACSVLAFSASTFSLSSDDNDFGSLLPFIIDSGASCHISLFLSNFKFITPIKPHPIIDLGDHSVSAVGMGMIKLQMPSDFLSLHEALFVPTSGVHLLSVYLLGKDGFNVLKSSSHVRLFSR